MSDSLRFYDRVLQRLTRRELLNIAWKLGLAAVAQPLVSTSAFAQPVFRTFPLSGRAKLQFRVEGFSLANQPQWSNPVNSVTSGSFMRITSTRGDPTTGGGARYVRFGVRVEF